MRAMWLRRRTRMRSCNPSRRPGELRLLRGPVPSWRTDWSR